MRASFIWAAVLVLVSGLLTASNANVDDDISAMELESLDQVSASTMTFKLS